MKNKYTLEEMLHEASTIRDYTTTGAAAGLAGGVATNYLKMSRYLQDAIASGDSAVAAARAVGVAIIIAQAIGAGAAVGFLAGVLKDLQMEDSEVRKILSKFKQKIGYTKS